MESYSSLSIEELARRCSSSGEVAAWEEFVRRVHALIAKVVYRTAQRLGDGSRQTVDDLIQEVYLKVCSQRCRLLREFESRHEAAFLGYLQVVAANVVRDHFKALRAKRRGEGPAVQIDESLDPAVSEGSAGSAFAVERGVLIDEIQRCLDDCLDGPECQRNERVFWLYYRTGLSASSIAALPGIGLSTKGVETLILRTTRQLRERMSVPNRTTPVAGGTAAEGILPAESF